MSQNITPPGCRILKGYLVTSFIMPERHFHFHPVVADRLPDHSAALPQLRKESESAARQYKNGNQVFHFKRIVGIFKDFYGFLGVK